MTNQFDSRNDHMKGGEAQPPAGGSSVKEERYEKEMCTILKRRNMGEHKRANIGIEKW